MTTRETTSLLARTDSGSIKKNFWDAAVVVSVGAFSWPWLLRSLDGGTTEEKTRLLQRLDLPAYALPK